MRAMRDHGGKDPAKAAEMLQASDTILVRIGLAMRATGLERGRLERGQDSPINKWVAEGGEKVRPFASPPAEGRHHMSFHGNGRLDPSSREAGG